MKKALAVLVALVLVVCAVAYAQSPVLNYGVDGSGNLTKIRTTTTGASEVTPVLATLVYTQGETAVACPTCPADICLPASNFNCCVPILPATEILPWTNVALTVTNLPTSAATVDNTIVEMSADGNYWETWDQVTFKALAVDSSKSLNISGNGRRYVRVRSGSCASLGSPSRVLAYITANNG